MNHEEVMERFFANLSSGKTLDLSGSKKAVFSDDTLSQETIS